MELLFIGAQELILLLPMAALYIYCLVHCIANKKLHGNSRLLWLIVILVAPFIGSLIYLIVGKKGSREEMA